MVNVLNRPFCPINCLLIILCPQIHQSGNPSHQIGWPIPLTFLFNPSILHVFLAQPFEAISVVPLTQFPPHYSLHAPNLGSSSALGRPAVPFTLYIRPPFFLLHPSKSSPFPLFCLPGGPTNTISERTKVKGGPKGWIGKWGKGQSRVGENGGTTEWTGIGEGQKIWWLASNDGWVRGKWAKVGLCLGVQSRLPAGSFFLFFALHRCSNRSHFSSNFCIILP